MSGENPIVDFTNTEIAFSDKSNQELRTTLWLFRMMNNSTLVELLSNTALIGIKLNLPLVKWTIKKTIFKHFCGGVNLLDCQPIIDRLYRMNVLTILDYGAERKNSEKDFDATMAETLKAIDFAASNESIPCVSTKITGLANMKLLEKKQAGLNLSTEEVAALERLEERMSKIGQRASDQGVAIFIDAEESWIQDTIDDLAEEMMREFNKEKAAVYNTVQLYRHDRLKYFYESHEKARKDGYILGMKLVRGAYMEKERERASEKGYLSPIHQDKPAVDKDFNEAIRYCVDHYETIASCNASHNWASNALQAQLIDDKGIYKNHPHLNFCQLYGMSDNITYNLADKGYNVAKYMPYGPVKEVMAYLIRRAQENTSVSGDMSRELRLLSEEIKRRGI